MWLIFIFPIILIIIWYLIDCGSLTFKRLKGNIMQSGELIVTGKDQASFMLIKCPALIKIRFEGDGCVIPCNPQHYDFLDWQLITESKNIFGHKHSLLIHWGVTGVRKIVWEAFY